MLTLHFRRVPRSRLKAGFTLIELLVVIAIISLLSSLVFSSLSSAREKAAMARGLADFRTINNAVLLYYHENGHYPPSNGALIVNTTAQGNWPTFMNSIRPYVAGDLLPVFESIGTANSLNQGYSYAKGTPTRPIRARTWNGVTGEFVACLTLYDGYWLDFLLPKQAPATLGDGGIDPDGIEFLEGRYVITNNPDDCS